MIKDITISALYAEIPAFLQPLFTNYTYPWEIVPHIKNYLYKLICTEPSGYTLYEDGILIGKDVTIHKSTTILSPTIIGHGTEIRTGAFIRGGVVTGCGCVIGNSTEVKNSILLDCVKLPHYNYVGDSILGKNVHLGASSICSNLKADKKTITVGDDTRIDTGLKKLGAMLGDDTEIGCGSVLNPGTIIGKRAIAYPLISLRGIYPEDSIIKGTKNVVKRKT